MLNAETSRRLPLWVDHLRLERNLSNSSLLELRGPLMAESELCSKLSGDI